MGSTGIIIALLLLSVVLNVSLLALYLKRRQAKADKAAEEEDAAAADTGERKTEYKLADFEIIHFTPNGPGLLKDLTVLVADDNEVNIDVLMAMLETMGLERLIVARNGQEAVAAAREHKVDLVYMDIQMPEMNGIEASKEILSDTRYRGLPIVPITGFSRIVNADMCEEAGMTGFLQKPVDMALLQAATRRALRKIQMFSDA